MISQEQGVISISVVSVVTGYILWMIIQSGGFLPYVSYATPHISNIVIFGALLSVLASGVLVSLGTLAINGINALKKKAKPLEGTQILLTNLLLDGAFFLIYILHVFRIIHVQWILLSCAIIWGIVAYGRFKEKHRNEKYLAKNARKTSDISVPPTSNQ